MPIYEYNCRQCGHEFEILLRTSADTPKVCPACGARRPVKGFSAFAVARRDPSPSCQACPTAESACSSGRCSSGACPFAGSQP